VIAKFEEAVRELKEIGLIPDYRHPAPTSSPAGQAIAALSPVTPAAANEPPTPNARLGKDRDGNPAWFIPDEKNPGKYLMARPTI
jgi:hypothetical protein